MLAAACALGGVVVWAYWPTVVGLVREWDRDPNYSVGMVVPFAALYLLWCDRSLLSKTRISVCWWGAGLLLFAQVVRFLGLMWLFESAERYALVMTIWGVVLLVVGSKMFFRVKWIMLFLLLMVPLPGRIHNAVSGPLQRVATDGAVVVLELAGLTVESEGHVIVLNDTTELAVAEACSGLRMLTAFIVVAAAFAYVIQKPTWQKAVLVFSSVPVAILCNIIRLIVTAVLFLVFSSELGKAFFHDFAGLTMMPIAVLMLMGELWIMSKLVLPDESPSPVPAAGK
jgi:exosortase